MKLGCAIEYSGRTVDMPIDRIKHLDGTDPADCEECGRIVLR